MDKVELLKLMEDTIRKNWSNPDMDTIGFYEQAIDMMCGGINPKKYTYNGQEQDVERLLDLLNKKYREVGIREVYCTIYDNLPWEFQRNALMRVE